MASAENEIFIKSTLPSLKSEQTLKLALPPYPPIQSRVFDTSSWKGSFQPPIVQWTIGAISYYIIDLLHRARDFHPSLIPTMTIVPINLSKNLKILLFYDVYCKSLQTFVHERLRFLYQNPVSTHSFLIR